MRARIKKINEEYLSISLQRYYAEDVKKLKQMKGGVWDPVNKHWVYPYSERTVRGLYTLFTASQIQLYGDLVADDRFINTKSLHMEGIHAVPMNDMEKDHLLGRIED